MRLLVFGSTGQLACELRRWCPPAWQMTALGRDAADLADPAACAAVVATARADLVVNAAAYNAVDRAEADEALACTVNSESPAAMAEAAAARRLPFLHLSTDYVFDGSGTSPWRPNDIAWPLNAYGRSKRLGEEGVLAAGGKGIIIRTSWLFSANGHNFVKTMLRLGSERATLDIVSDQVGGPTPASDLAIALLIIGKSLADRDIRGGIFHFAGEPDVSRADFARHIFAVSGLAVQVRDIESRDYPAPAQRPANSRLDCESLKAVFGVDRPDWRQGLREVLDELDADGNHDAVQLPHDRRGHGMAPQADQSGRLEALAARLR